MVFIRRYHLPLRIAETHCGDRLRVGSPRDGLYHARDTASFAIFDEVSPPTEEVRAYRGLQRLQRPSIYDFLDM